MTKEKRKIPKFSGVVIECPYCEQHVFLGEEIVLFMWTHSESPCELCGSHGNVGLDVGLMNCPHCNQKIDVDIELMEW